jgi:hypothetical protein
VVNAQIQYSPDFVFPAPAHASEEMAAVIRKMCGYRSEDRYQSIEEVLMDIGRIDGSYTENGFEDTSDGENTEILEGELLTTAFYTEVTDGDSNELEQPESTSAHKDNKVGTTRFHRKVMEQIYNERYTWSGIWHFLLSALLFFALFKAFPPEAEYADDWMLLVLPAALLAEAVLQRAKELHILIGSFLCVLCLYSIYIKGFDILHAVTIAVVIFEIPSLTAGCAVGAGLWLVQMATGACAWLNVLNRFDCGWIVIILLFVVVDGMMDACIKYHKTSYVRVCIWNFISYFLWIVLVVAGIVLIAGKSRGSIAVPDIFSRIHLIRVGVGIFLLQTVTFRRFKIVQFVKEGWL